MAIQRWQRPFMCAAVAALALLVTACGSAPQDQASSSNVQTVVLGEPDIPAGQTPGQAPTGKVMKTVKPAPEFTLTNQDGKPFSTADAKGHIAVVLFGFTHCPDFCPGALAEMGQASKKLGADAEKVRFVFITVDPERDKPADMKAFVEHFGFAPGTIEALTGTPDQLRAVWDGFGVVTEKVPLQGTDYSVNHTAKTWVIDTKGQLRLYHLGVTKADDLVSDLRWLLSEKS